MCFRRGKIGGRSYSDVYIVWLFTVVSVSIVTVGLVPRHRIPYDVNDVLDNMIGLEIGVVMSNTIYGKCRLSQMI